MVGFYIKFKAQPGQREALIGHLLHATNALREFDGCFRFGRSTSNFKSFQDAILLRVRHSGETSRYPSCAGLSLSTERCIVTISTGAIESAHYMMEL